MQDFEKVFGDYVKRLEEKLPDYLPDAGEASKTLADAMSYSLLSGGKRIRAVLLLSCYALFDSDFTKALPFAAGVEMVHAYSLIHDDLPCMDDDDMRRGKPSCHIAFGEAEAVLAGDGLLTLAFETLTSYEAVESFGAGKVLGAVRLLSSAAGARGMVGGQMLDIENENRDVTVETLIQIDGKKTGALICAACETGCMLGGADKKTTEHVLNYAKKLGLAFQIVDDALDVCGDEKELGKPVGSDGEKNKRTYASIYGGEKAIQEAKKLTDEAKAELAATRLETEFLCGLADMLASRKH